VDATGAFIPTVDADGHFAGGVRLPHVESMVRGRVACAPLGRHRPLNPRGLDPFDPFAFVGGAFTRFSDHDLLARYPSRRQYVKRVSRAAGSLAARGYITNRDRRALVTAAELEPLPCGQEDDDGNDLHGETRCARSPLH
jgi:hypothetical protein